MVDLVAIVDIVGEDRPATSEHSPELLEIIDAGAELRRRATDALIEAARRG